MSEDTVAGEVTNAATRRVWGALLVLTLIGVVAVVYRLAFFSNAAAHAEPWRSWLMERMGLTDPLQVERASRVAEFDRRFAEHAVATLLHIVGGGLFLLLLPLQFVAPLRRRCPAVHRWLGRALIGALMTATAAAWYFALLMPFGGVGETVVITLVGSWCLIAVARGVRAVRGGEVARHREWMIRAAAVPLGVSTVRIVAAPLELLLLPTALGPQRVFVVTLWIGWALTLAGAEWWIRRSRRGRARLGQSAAFAYLPPTEVGARSSIG